MGLGLKDKYAGVTYTLLWAVLQSAIIMFFEGPVFTRACAAVTRMDNRIRQHVGCDAEWISDFKSEGGLS